jgi:hypothetical protein
VSSADPFFASERLRLRHRLSGEAIPDEPGWKFVNGVRQAGRRSKAAVLPDLRLPFSARDATQRRCRRGRVGAPTAPARRARVLKNALTNETGSLRSTASQEVF